MIKRLFALRVKGKSHDYYFQVWLDPQFLDEWREEGIELDEIINTIPGWLPSVLVKPWVVLQDIFNFRLLSRK